MASLSFDAVGKRYDNVTALAALDLDVGDGEALCLLGPSGAGKSTALRIAAGLEQVSSGRVLIDDVDVTRRPAAQRDLAMVFQSYALFPHLDVAGNIGFGLAVRKVAKSEIRRLVGDVAELVGCGHLLHRRPAQLSGGERQRVAVARALVRRPAILLLDEPLSNLDPALRADMRTELRRLHDSVGTTMVHVTHDQFEALAIGDRVAIVRDGQLEQTASPDDVYRRPTNRFVATFVGQPRMNVLPATRTGTAIVVGPFGLPHGLAPDGPLDAGIRPEHLQLGDPDGVPADVELVERAGDVTIAHLRSGAHQLVGRFGADAGIRAGDRVVVGAPAHRWFFFDRRTGSTVRFRVMIRRPGSTLESWVLLTPFLLGVALLVVGPAAWTLALSLFDADLVTTPVRRGLGNFNELIHDGIFQAAVRNSLLFIAGSVPLRAVAALGAALLLHKSFSGARAYRTIVFLPTAVPDVAFALAWLWILNPLYGPLNLALGMIGIDGPAWLSDPWAARAGLVLMSVFTVGEGFLIAMATRRSIPADLYELAWLEGARNWATLRRVTLPLMAPTLVLLLIRDTIYSFQSSFVPALVVTDGGPAPYATTFLPLFIYRNGFEYLRFGYAAAATVVMLALNAVLIAMQYAILRRWRHARVA